MGGLKFDKDYDDDDKGDDNNDTEDTDDNNDDGNPKDQNFTNNIMMLIFLKMAIGNTGIGDENGNDDDNDDDIDDDDDDDDDGDIFTILIVSVSCFKLWQTLCFATD